MGDRAILGSVGETASEGDSSNHSEFEIPYKMLMSFDSRMTVTDHESVSPTMPGLERQATLKKIAEGAGPTGILPIKHDQIKKRIGRIPFM